MKNYLIIDTSESILKIAVSIDDKMNYLDYNNGFTHVEDLIPLIKKSLSDIDKSVNDLDYAGVCQGPGSFTGIRIGISTILGLTFQTKIKSFGFSVFDVYKELIKTANTVLVPVIDAKKNRFYCSFIEGDNYQYYDYTKEEILEKVQSFHKKIIFTGKDFKLIENIFQGSDYQYLYNTNYTGKDLLFYGNVLSGNKLSEPEPIYLRKSEAEISLLKSKNLQ